MITRETPVEKTSYLFASSQLQQVQPISLMSSLLC